MIQMMIEGSSEGERLSIKQSTREKAAIYTEDKWEFVLCARPEDAERCLREQRAFDMLCMDITLPGALEITERLRLENRDAFLVLVADESISPVRYMKPGIMAGNLMLKPLSPEKIDETMEESVRAFSADREKPDLNRVFVAESREGRWIVPYDRIQFFEARNKKIYLNSVNEEIGFYATIDELEKQLPEEFVRCHRGFIVNRNRIERVVAGENTIVLSDGTGIPVSRSYRSIIKELRRKK